MAAHDDQIQQAVRGWWAQWTREAADRLLILARRRSASERADDWREEAYEAERAKNPARARYLLAWADRMEGSAR